MKITTLTIDYLKSVLSAGDIVRLKYYGNFTGPRVYEGISRCDSAQVVRQTCFDCYEGYTLDTEGNTPGRGFCLNTCLECIEVEKTVKINKVMEV